MTFRLKSTSPILKRSGGSSNKGESSQQRYILISTSSILLASNESFLPIWLTLWLSNGIPGSALTGSDSSLY